MGTNFYWVGIPGDEDTPSDDLNPEYHIGKRSAAGLYCWDCDDTLCMGGRSRIHFTTGRDEWHTACPRCGTEPVKTDSLSSGPAAVELGFAQPELQRPSGVRGCSSFTWAQDPESVGVKCRQSDDLELIADEYGHRMSGADFLRMLESNCPVQFTDSIGTWFS